MIPIAIFSTDREAGVGPASRGTSVALEELGRLSGAASQRSDAILRSMELAQPHAGSAGAPPFLATDAGNAAVQKCLSAGVAWLKGLTPAP